MKDWRYWLAEQRGTLLALGIFIAMFQIPNKFFEQDGRVLDSTGKNWDEAWGSLLAK